MFFHGAEMMLSHILATPFATRN